MSSLPGATPTTTARAIVEKREWPLAAIATIRGRSP